MTSDPTVSDRTVSAPPPTAVGPDAPPAEVFERPSPLAGATSGRVAHKRGDRDGLRPSPPSTTRNVVEWVVIIAVALGVALFIKTYLIQAFYIPSASMEHSLNISDRVLVNKLSYRLHGVNRGDIVVFKRPPNEGGDVNIKDLIKRVVALPGETIEANEGKVYIDGHELREPYLGPDVETSNLPRQKVPPGHYWVMGDNRGNSKDARVFGPIPKDLIVGRAFVRVWPLSALSLL